MIGTSIPEYLFIRASILGLKLVAPLSALYLVVGLCRGTFIPSLFGWYALAEYAFVTLVYLPRRRSLQEPAKHPTLDASQRRALVEKVLNCAEDPNVPSGWFHLRPLSTIKKGNYLEWIYWAIFSVAPDSEEAQQYEEEVEDYLRFREEIYGPLEDGYDPDVKTVRVTLDPVASTHRPLIWYLVVGLLDIVTYSALHRTRFQHYTRSSLFASFPPRLGTLLSQESPVKELSYWYKPHCSTTKHPIVFIHGIGVGLWPYHAFIKSLTSQNPDVGVLILEVLPISSRITQPPFDSRTTCQTIEKILDFHKISRFVILSHSYGTSITAQVLHFPTLSPRVVATLLVDPINFLLHHPSVAYNFLYRSPRSANEWQLWYFASTDPDIARVLNRHFFWTECILWKEELIGKKFAISLSEKDQIVDTASVRKYLTGKEERYFREDNLEVLWNPGLDHAMVFDSEATTEPLIEILNRFTNVDE